MSAVSLRAFTLALSFLAVQAQAQDLPATLASLTTSPAVARANWGIMVTALDGTPIYSLNEGKLFQPASNMKLFTTAAALALIGGDATVSTTVTGSGIFVGKDHLKGNLYLGGSGDANLSGRAVPYARNSEEAFPPLRSLDELAAQVAQTGLKRVEGDVLGVAFHEAWQPYPPGWSSDDLVWGYGAPVSRLSIDDNEVKLTIRPADEAGSRATIEFSPDVSYFTVTNDVMTVSAGSPTRVEIERNPGSKAVRIYGRIALKASADTEHIAITDPVEFASIAFKGLLAEHGVIVTGQARAEHWPQQDARGFREIARQPIDLQKMMAIGYSSLSGSIACSTPQDLASCPRNTILASHTSPSLREDVTLTNKLSLNLHAELLSLRLGDRFTSGGLFEGNSFAQGVRVTRQFLIDAGVSGDDLVLNDGSGLSTYDLVTPRAIAKLLQFATKQPWFADYKASLPIGGVDGSLEHRFTVAPLKGHVFAKTGTLGEARALSGYLDCASGRMVIFSILAGNHDPTTSADREVMDKIVAAIAAAN